MWDVTGTRDGVNVNGIQVGQPAKPAGSVFNAPLAMAVMEIGDSPKADD